MNNPYESSGQEVVALVSDLMFSSKITATAQAVGVGVRVLRDPAKLVEAGGKLLLVDLSRAGVIEAAVGWKKATSGRVVGFVSHVDQEAIERAREAGLDLVLARSAFTAQLETILQGR